MVGSSARRGDRRHRIAGDYRAVERVFPSLRRADALTPEALVNAELEQTGQEVRKL